MAVAGLTTPSMAAAISGSSKRKASISQEMSTSSGSRVRRLGHDGDVVEPVRPPTRLADADLDLSHPCSRLAQPSGYRSDVERDLGERKPGASVARGLPPRVPGRPKA